MLEDWVMKLLTTNAKLSKSPEGTNFLVVGLAIAPASIGGVNVCTGSSEACRDACNLWHAGRTVMPGVRKAMLERKDFLFADPVGFRVQLRKELRLAQKRAAKVGAELLVRLNVSSDLDWSDIIAEFPDVRFYDYSKVYSRRSKLANYSITYSRSERTPDDKIRAILERGENVAVVFAVDYFPSLHRIGALPETYLGFPVVDGDLHDFRLPETDGRGVVVGLRLKGGRKEKREGAASGFAVTPE